MFLYLSGQSCGLKLNVRIKLLFPNRNQLVVGNRNEEFPSKRDGDDDHSSEIKADQGLVHHWTSGNQSLGMVFGY